MNPVKIIAEIGQAHEGSLGIAHSYIDALAETGVDIVKFQTHISEAESSPEEPFRVNFSYEDKTRSDYWKRMEFTLDQWQGLKNHCNEVGLEFMSTPTCLAAVDLLEKINVGRYKVGSGDLTNKLLLKKVTETKKPIIISTGMSTIPEIHESINFLKKFNANTSILHCTSKYPTKPEDLRLELITKYKTEFGCPIGFSDHSNNIYSILAATTLGAEIIEFHVVFDKMMFGPDSSSSLIIDEVHTLVEGIRYIEKSINASSKDKLDDGLLAMKRIFEKSLSVNKTLEKGHVLSFEDLESKKPAGMGVPASDFEIVIGKKLTRNKKQWSFIIPQDLN